MHFTGYPMTHRVSPHFLWGKNLQCTNWAWPPMSPFCQKAGTAMPLLLAPDLNRTPVHIKGCFLLWAPHTGFLWMICSLEYNWRDHALLAKITSVTQKNVPSIILLSLVLFLSNSRYSIKKLKTCFIFLDFWMVC